MSTRTIVAPAVPTTAARSGLVSAPEIPTPARQKQLVELWHPWVSRNWPCTAIEEQVFMTDLEVLAARYDSDDEDEYDRRDVTSLVTALRSGLTADDLLSRARGLRPVRLLAAHRALERQRLLSEHAWRAIVETPTAASLNHYGDLATRLLPVIISHLDSIERRSGRDLEQSILNADAEISRTSQAVQMLEGRLGHCTEPSERGREIGALLFDSCGEGAWSLGTFMAPRVGALIPLRVAALLGEGLHGRLRRAS